MAPSVRWFAGVSTSSAPNALRMRFRSSLADSGIAKQSR